MGDSMLVKFTVSNYKNFLNPITLDLVAKHDYQFNSDLIRDGLLSKVLIYGKNASGKSNLGFALFDIVGVLTDKNIQPAQKDSTSFLNADSAQNTARFEYVFKKNEDYITYIYEKTAPNDIYYEELLVNSVKIFSYNFHTKEKSFENLEMIESNTLNFEYYENNLPILRYIANNTNQPDDSIVRFIMNFVSHMLWFRSLEENGYIGFTTGSESLQDWIINNNLLEEFQDFLKRLADIDIKLITLQTTTPNKNVLVERHKKSSLIFENVSSNGTKALELLFYWSKRFEEVSFLFMDEFDAFYHFDLARNVIDQIVKSVYAQAVVTTHNSFLADNALLRPDCYFTLKDGKLVSFADSTDRELREGHNLEKMLRNGEFDV